MLADNVVTVTTIGVTGMGVMSIRELKAKMSKAIAAVEQMKARLKAGIPGLTGPATDEERTRR